jgi:2,4-dienoyl-CoA reductase-like NADH-dependent reductase (Old Yellow Enzyme family)
MNKLLTPLTFPRGVSIKNRFMLAPLKNTQIDEERVMSESI